MRKTKKFTFTIVFLIFVMFLSLTNVSPVLADDGTPPEPPPAESTDEPTEPPAEATEVPVEATAIPEEPAESPVVATEAPVEETEADTAVEEVIAQLPEDTNIVVLDEEGNPVSLASQEASDIILDTDPMWCPAGALPGDPECTTNFVSIGALVTDMRNTDMANNLGSTYTQDGIIYFTSSVSASFNLTTGLNTVFANNFDTIKNFNLTLQGGWNGSNGASATFTGQTDFGTNRITIGTAANPWVGNITLNNFTFSNATSTPITVRTTSGDITLDNIDVVDQSGATNTGVLVSSTGDITVQNSSFDGNAADQSRGFSATTGGSITISDTTFQESRRTSASAAYNGATLSASTITLTNVIASNNDGSGILALNYDLLTLNNVAANNNGKEAGSPGILGNFGSGIEADGNLVSKIIIIGGSFNNNFRYGVEVTNSTVYVQSNPTCTGNVGGCYDVATIFDNTPPAVAAIISGTLGNNGWYTSDVTINWDVSDGESGILPPMSGCDLTTITIETAGSTFTCSVTNNAGLSSSLPVTIKIDKTGPVLTLPANINLETTDPSGAIVNYSASVTDNLDSNAAATCSPASGSTFPAGTTTVDCSSTDEAGNISTQSFDITVTVKEIIVEPTPTEEPPPTEPGESNGGEEGGDEGDGSQQSGDTIPLTGGNLFDIPCPPSSFTQTLEDVQVIFTNLCGGYQGSLDQLEENGLPGDLPTGEAFIGGLTINVLKDSEIINPLPKDAKLTIRIKIPDDAKHKDFVVMFWDGTKWVGVDSQQTTDGYFQFISMQGGMFILLGK